MLEAADAVFAHIRQRQLRGTAPSRELRFIAQDAVSDDAPLRDIALPGRQYTSNQGGLRVAFLSTFSDFNPDRTTLLGQDRRTAIARGTRRALHPAYDLEVQRQPGAIADQLLLVAQARVGMRSSRACGRRAGPRHAR